jgi:hypothetical protein
MRSCDRLLLASSLHFRLRTVRGHGALTIYIQNYRNKPNAAYLVLRSVRRTGRTRTAYGTPYTARNRKSQHDDHDDDGTAWTMATK